MHDQLPGHLLSVYRFAMHLCGDQHVAEDLTQEAMLRGLRRIDSLNDPHALKMWLFRIVRNLWTDRCRSKKHLTATPFPEDEFVGNERDPSEIVAKCEEVTRSLAAMATLPDRQRNILHLIACQQFSIAEVADVLEITPEAVRSSLSLARAQMRKIVYTPDATTHTSTKKTK